MRVIQPRCLITALILTCTLIGHSAGACDLDKLNRGQAGHGCTPDTGPGVSSPAVNPGTAFRTLIELTPTNHPGITNPQRPSRPGDTVPANSDTRINRFGPPIPAQPNLTRRIYLTDQWRAVHGNSSFPLNVKSLAKYEEFKAHLENRDKGHECYYPVTNSAGGCLACRADWSPRNYLVSGPMDCGSGDTGWRPAVETAGTVPDGKACPRAFFTNACSPRQQHTAPTLDQGRTCNPERSALDNANDALSQCLIDQQSDSNIDCTGEQAAVTAAQRDLNQCENLPPCQWNYNPGPWSPWKPARSGECPMPFTQSSVRTLAPSIIGSPGSCRHTSPNLPPHERQQTVTGTRPASDQDCGGGTNLPACTTWNTGPWDNPLSDADLAAQTCIGDTETNTRTVTAGPAPCTGAPPSNPPAATKVIAGTQQCATNPPVDGLCDNSAFARCHDGTAINQDAVANTWVCQGQHGGSDSAQCRYNPAPVNGLCDETAFGLCADGDPILLNTMNNTWSCQGRNGGSTDNCTFTPVTIQNGQCDNTTFGECLQGNPTNLNPPNAWTCRGLNGGLADFCNPPMVNGQCDNDNLGQCLAGNPTTVAGINWNCEGLFGGLDAPKCEFTGVDTDPDDPDNTGPGDPGTGGDDCPSFIPDTPTEGRCGSAYLTCDQGDPALLWGSTWICATPDASLATAAMCNTLSATVHGQCSNERFRCASGHETICGVDCELGPLGTCISFPDTGGNWYCAGANGGRNTQLCDTN